MIGILDKKYEEATTRYFALVFVIAVIPSIAVSTFFVLAWQSGFLHFDFPIDYLAENLPLWRQLIQNALLPGILESLLLIFPTVVASSAITNQYRAALIGCIPVVLLHVSINWIKPISVAWFFFVYAYVYLELRRSGQSFKQAFVFVALAHMIGNAGLTLFMNL